MSNADRAKALIEQFHAGDVHALRVLADLMEEAGERFGVTLVAAGDVIVSPTGTCAYDGCGQPATAIARGREEGHRKPACYCDTHARAVADEGSPEYTAICDNCGCMEPIN